MAAASLWAERRANSEHELASSNRLCSWKGDTARGARCGLRQGKGRHFYLLNISSQLHATTGGQICLLCATCQPCAHPPLPFLSPQAALATSLDLRCFLLLLPRQDGSIVLELQDIRLVRKWTVEELWRQCVDPATGVTLDQLRQFAGIHSEGETPSVQSLATLAFLYLLAHIYKDKLRYVLQICTIGCLPELYLYHSSGLSP